MYRSHFFFFHQSDKRFVVSEQQFLLMIKSVIAKYVRSKLNQCFKKKSFLSISNGETGSLFTTI